MIKAKSLFVVFLMMIPFISFSQADTIQKNHEKLVWKEKGISVTGQWFLAFQHINKTGSPEQNAFFLRRGYITYRKDISQKLSVRFTQDIITDEEGDDAGNIEMRLKYCYLKANPFNRGMFKNSHFEIGMVHRPYLDFEERINGYRLQGNMFLERYKVINSADFGITWFGLLGGKMETPYPSSISSPYPGRFGSFSIGIYNGGGYHALELNRNKTLEGRLSLRPFYNRLPGLQFTYAFVFGKGNNDLHHDFRKNVFFVSYESLRYRGGLQLYQGTGNMAGTFMDINQHVQSAQGYSVFSELFIIPDKWAAYSRFDYFKILDQNVPVQQRLIGGLSWYFFKKNRVLFHTDLLQKDHHYTRVYEAVIEILL